VTGGRRLPGILAATVLGTGYSPVAPGTAGSLVAAAAFLAVRQGLPGWVCFALLPPVLVLAAWGCRAGFSMWGDDPPRVTADEFAGCWIACLAAPRTWGVAGIAAAFLLFRLFDIAKPWPVSAFDRISTPWGILLDDLAAGLYAALATGAAVIIHARIL